MGKKIRVVVANVMERAEVREIDTDLDGMQAAVGGYIELFAKTPDGIDWWCNETGRIDGLPLNRIVLDGFDIHGPILCTATDEEGEGETIGLSDEQVAIALDHLNNHCRIAVHFERPLPDANKLS